MFHANYYANVWYLREVISWASIWAATDSSPSMLLIASMRVAQVTGWFEAAERSHSFMVSLKHMLLSPLRLAWILSSCFPSSSSARPSAVPNSSHLLAKCGFTRLWSLLIFGLDSRPEVLLNAVLLYRDSVNRRHMQHHASIYLWSDQW